MSTAEAASLRFQHRLFFRELGTLFPETIPLGEVAHVLDLSCGPGAWLIEVAQTYPHMHGIGVEQKPELLYTAREDAQIAHTNGAAFELVKQYERLPYLDNSFDFIHIQRSSAAITPRKWPSVLRELARVLRPGGWLHFLDFEIGPTSSAALNTFIDYLRVSHLKTKRVFSAESLALTSAVLFPRLLKESGWVETSYTLHAVDIGNQLGSAGKDYIFSVLTEDTRIVQYLVAAGVVTQAEIERVVATIRQDVVRLKYCATGMLISVVSRKPEEK